MDATLHIARNVRPSAAHGVALFFFFSAIFFHSGRYFFGVFWRIDKCDVTLRIRVRPETLGKGITLLEHVS